MKVSMPDLRMKKNTPDYQRNSFCDRWARYRQLRHFPLCWIISTWIFCQSTENTALGVIVATQLICSNYAVLLFEHNGSSLHTVDRSHSHLRGTQDRLPWLESNPPLHFLVRGSRFVVTSDPLHHSRSFRDGKLHTLPREV